MATSTSLGRSPQKRGPAGLIIAVATPKPGGAADHTPPRQAAPDEAEPKEETQEPAEHEQKISPDAAWFTGPDHVCAACEHFDSNGNNGVGECSEVEADYVKNDPNSSQCRLFEQKEGVTEEQHEEVLA